MEKFTIDGYEYHCDSKEKPIEGVVVQLNGGDEKPIVRKIEYCTDNQEMLRIGEEKGYYPYFGKYSLRDVLPVTWTNNPHLITEP